MWNKGEALKEVRPLEKKTGNPDTLDEVIWIY